MNKAGILKRNVIDIILDLGLFQVVGGFDKKRLDFIKKWRASSSFFEHG